MFGFERTQQAIINRPPISTVAMLEHLKVESAVFTGQIELHDDTTIVVIRV